MAATTTLPTAAETRAAPKPKLLGRLREVSRSRPYCRRTEQTYCASARLAKAAVPASADGLVRFISLLSFVPRKRIGRDEGSGRGHRSSQRPQPQSCVLDSPIGDPGQVIRARKPTRLPVVMTREEVKTVRDAVAKAGLTKRAACHTFRHSFATHLLEGGYKIPPVHDLRGRSRAKTTMIYTPACAVLGPAGRHVLNRGPAGLRSPVDGL